MHVLRTVIFIAAIAVDALLGTEASTEANPNPQPLEGESEARNKGILSLMTGRWPGTSPAPSKLALLASLIAVLVGVRYYALMSRSSIGKQYSPEKRSLAGSQQSPPLKPPPPINPAPHPLVIPLWFEAERRERREETRKLLCRAIETDLEEVAEIPISDPEEVYIQIERSLRQELIKFEEEGLKKLAANVKLEKLPIERDESNWFVAAVFLKAQEYKEKVHEFTGKRIDQLGAEKIPQLLENVAWQMILNIRVAIKFLPQLEAVEARMRSGFTDMASPLTMERLMAIPEIKKIRESLTTNIMAGLYGSLRKRSRGWMISAIDDVYKDLDKFTLEVMKKLGMTQKLKLALRAYKKELTDLLLSIVRA
uniref:Uncharacterized protein n=1 Tax=Eimeria tenella TaxID=5802 RepID=H9BA50_EIMTE|nr:hypothetical protein [Eimeria tenella]